MKKITVILSMMVLLCMMIGCKKESEKKIEILPIEFDLFSYDLTKDVEAIAVDENGLLYTSKFVEVEGREYKEEEYQHISVYDLEGNCLEEVDVKMSNGIVHTMFIEDRTLYVVSNRSGFGLTLYEVNLDTWEAKPITTLEEYNGMHRMVSIGEYFYLIGDSEFGSTDYELHPEVEYFYYTGKVVGRIDIHAEQPEVELLAIDFPIDIFETQNNTLMIYQYTEENGFGFLEFNPESLTLQEISWTKESRPRTSFTMCEEGFLCMDNWVLYYGTVDGRKAELATENALLRDGVAPVYEKGFAFYLNYLTYKVERISVTDVLKDNKEIKLMMHQTNANQPFGCGYQMKIEEKNMEEFALKLLAQDSDFDMYLLSSRDSNSYNIKEEGVFYALNEVEGVKEYLDACFPYIKDVATNEEGDIWMLPVGLMVSGLMYDKDYCASQGVDFSTMNFKQFLSFTEDAQKESRNKISIGTYLMEEALFQQYLKEQTSFDTELFRNIAKQMRSLYESCDGEIQSELLMPTRLNVIAQGEIPQFYYDYEYHGENWLDYAKMVTELGEEERIGVTSVPSASKKVGNVGTLTFLAVNPQSENLEATLSYISTLARYMMGLENSFLLADEATYLDTPFMKQCYELYENGMVYFAMDSQVYWDDFEAYLDGEMELEEMVSELERKREIYVEE